MRTMIAAALLLIAAKTLAQNEAAQVGADQQPSHAIQNDGNSDEIENRSEYCSFLFSPPVAETRCPESASDKQKIEDEGSEFWPVFGHRLKITDSLLVIFTFILAAYTIRLWSATRRLAEGSEKTAKAQLRAYVGQRTAHPERLWYEYNVTVRLRNYGATPAYSVLIWSDLLALTPEEAESHPFDKVKGDSPSDPFTIFPRSKPHTHVCKQTFTEQEVSEIMDFSRRLYMVGEIQYTDTFGDRWTTRFRMFFYMYQGADLMTVGMWRYCDQGNSAT